MTLTWRLDESLKLTLHRMLPKVLEVTAVSSLFANMHTNIAKITSAIQPLFVKACGSYRVKVNIMV